MNGQRLVDMRRHAFTAREEARRFRTEARKTAKNRKDLKRERLYEARRADAVAVQIELELALRGYQPARSASEFGCAPRADASTTMPTPGVLSSQGSAESCADNGAGAAATPPPQPAAGVTAPHVSEESSPDIFWCVECRKNAAFGGDMLCRYCWCSLHGEDYYRLKGEEL